jgi:1,4-dihydroxy-2-naphthoate octaprenyltransferase
MAIAALITWLVTAIGGIAMLSIWISRGGHRPDSGSRLPAGLVFGHVALAVIGLVVWIIYIAIDANALTWAAFVLLLPVALLGFIMLARWIPARHVDTAESRFPVPIVLGHGLFAVTTLVLVLLHAISELGD